MKKLNILYEDEFIIIVDKPVNLLTIANSKTSKSLYSEVYDYLHKKNQKVFIVHRLDKDTSGLVLFAKSESMKRTLQDNWDNVKRGYIALVHGKTKDSEVLKSYLKESKTLLVYSTNDKKQGKLAITEYKKIKDNNKYSLLDINIKTGRKHQIRVGLNDINHPILGDKKYGIKDSEKRLYLDAYYLLFKHSKTNKEIEIKKDIPVEFIKRVTK